MALIERTAAAAMLAAAIACGHGSPSSPSGSDSTTPSGLPSTPSFSRSPLDLAVVSSITPIGNLNPPDHTLPTNHSYWFHPSAPNAEVVAPAGGIVQSLTHGTNGADDQLYVAVTPHVAYYLDHIRLDSGIAQGARLAPGTRIGVTASSATALDVGVVDDAVTLFFARPDRYIPGTLHAVSPFKYFDEPVRSQLYAKVNRIGADKDGRIDFDVTGRLAGNWFTPDLPAQSTENFGNGSKHLSFARDVIDPSQIRISIGGTLSVTGVYYVQDAAPDPADVSAASGRVAYQLFIARGATLPAGVLVAQILTDTSVRLETFPENVPLTTDFTGAAVTYVR